MTAFDGDDGPTRLPRETRMECGVCWTVYDPAAGDPARQIPPGTGFADLPDDWCCPNCDAPRNEFLVVGVGRADGRG